MYCFHCAGAIDKYYNVYKAYDRDYCSKYCRSKHLLKYSKDIDQKLKYDYNYSKHNYRIVNTWTVNINIKNFNEDTSNKHEDTSNKHEDTSNKHEDTSNKHEDTSNKHEDTSNKNETENYITKYLYNIFAYYL